MAVMQVAKCYRDLGSVKLHSIFLKSSLLSQVTEELSTWNVFHYEVDTIGPLKDILHGDDEGIGDLEQDKLLKFNIF